MTQGIYQSDQLPGLLPRVQLFKPLYPHCRTLSLRTLVLSYLRTPLSQLPTNSLRWNDRRAVNLHCDRPTEEFNRDDEQTLLRLAPDQDAFDACQEALCDADPVPFRQIRVRPSWKV